MSRPTPLRIVLVGYGPVGSRFIEELLPAVVDGTITLTVVGSEPADAYNRVLVAEYAVGHTDREALTISDRAAIEAAGVRVVTGMTATGIDRDTRTVVLATGETLPYDRLVLATGARANVPTLDGVARVRRDLSTLLKHGSSLVGVDDALPDGITVLRDLGDAETVAGAVLAGRRIVVLGAGVLGLEIALAAARAGAEVAVVHHGGYPMPRNLDRGGGTVLKAALRAAGVTVVENSRAEAVSFHSDVLGERRFDALITADGKQIRGDLLLLSCGVSARSELATLAGLRTGAGVLVDRGLSSWTDPSVFAIGDCAHVVDRTPESEALTVLPGGPSGLIGPGWRQAVWLAAHFRAELAGTAVETKIAEERAALVMLKAEGVDVVATGDVSAEPWDVDHDASADAAGVRRVAQWADPENGSYVKMVSRGGILTAFVAVGMPRTASELTLLFERGDELPADRSVLLRFDGPDYEPESAADQFAPASTVCWCNGVTVAHIADSAACGNTTVSCIGKDTRAGTGCGGCKNRIAELLTHLESADGAQSPSR
ncbi:MAG TPA: FAD-dependent oxidoreductase [Microterricola sp.]